MIGIEVYGFDMWLGFRVMNINDARMFRLSEEGKISMWTPPALKIMVTDRVSLRLLLSKRWR